MNINNALHEAMMINIKTMMTIAEARRCKELLDDLVFAWESGHLSVEDCKAKIREVEERFHRFCEENKP